MYRVGLFGIGNMGRRHLLSLLRLEAEGRVELVSICDFDEKKHRGDFGVQNVIAEADSVEEYQLDRLKKYLDIDEMFENETFDVVDIVLPTYLHAETAIKAFKRGIHVLSEKPMANNVQQCEALLEAWKQSGKLYMVEQVLRFAPAYSFVKACVEDGRFGPMEFAHLFRGGSLPRGSWQNWYWDKEKGGGAVLDQHIHDVDFVNWAFGLPEYASSVGNTVVEGSGNDMVSTHFIYPDNKVVCVQNDWNNKGAFPFTGRFRINFQKATLVAPGGNSVTVYPVEGEPYQADLTPSEGVYTEISYFLDCLDSGTQPEICTPQSTADTIRMVMAEVASIEKKGERVRV